MTRASRFLGAARSVTGSRFLLATDRRTLLVDCGLSQERDMQAKNWEPFPVPPTASTRCCSPTRTSITAACFPGWCARAFAGRIYATGPTAEIARIVMLDSARLQVEDVEQKKRRHEQEGSDSARTPWCRCTREGRGEGRLPVSRRRVRGDRRPARAALEAEFFEAGHILGSASIRVRTGGNGAARGRSCSPATSAGGTGPSSTIPRPATRPTTSLMESTYGDRLHGDDAQIGESLAEDRDATPLRAGGNIVIPSFAIERSQEVLYYLNTLLRENRIPHLLVFLDSPMATRVTDVFVNWPGYFDPEMMKLITREPLAVRPPGARHDPQQRGVEGDQPDHGQRDHHCGGGHVHGRPDQAPPPAQHRRAREHDPVRRLPGRGDARPADRGRGATQVRILGEMHPVKARVEKIEGFSAHADRDELLRWASAITEKPRRAFVIHGEAPVAEHFSATLAGKMGWHAEVPAPGQAVDLD